MIPQKQLTLADIFEDCKEIFDSDKPQFLTLLENHIDLDEIVPISFRRHYYASKGRNRKYPLNDFLQDLQSVFDKLVDVTEPICHDIDSNLTSMLLFDTSGIEAYKPLIA